MTMQYRFKRRSFLAGIGAAAGLASLLRRVEEAEAQAPAPQRILFIQRPVGTVPQHWFPPPSQGQNFELPRILQPFAALRDRMVIFEDLRLPSQGSVGGGAERGTVLMLTGARTLRLYPGNGGDDPIAEGPSFDQHLVNGAAGLAGTAIPSLQVGCDPRADTPGEVSTRHMSYSGAEAPLTPYYQPLDAYRSVFGTLMPGGANAGNQAVLLRARRQRKSVLDFMQRDLARLRELAPASQREQLDMHAAAIRELEIEFDTPPGGSPSCAVPAAPEVLSVSTQLDPYTGTHVVPQRDDETLSRIGALHMAVIKAAFRCDLTRVVTFQWAPGTNHVSFGGLWPPDPTVFKVHHTTSHDPASADLTEFLTRVEEFYALRVASFLQDLAAEPEAGGNGSLLDNTLVPYITEVAERTSTWTRMPFLLLGGKSLGLVGNRLWTNDGAGQRFTNDLWMAIAEAFDMPGFVLGDADLHTTPIRGLFA
jgi:hypothetical protein